MRKDIVINLDNYGNAANYKQAIGISGENLQGRLLFQLESPIDGEGYVELLHDGIAELVPAEKEDNKIYYIPINQYNKDYDMFLKGNLGGNGEDGIIDRINNEKNAIYLLKKSGLNWQNPSKVRKYIIDNLEYSEDFLNFFVFNSKV